MNQTVETPVSLLDIYPTITDLAGISSQPNKLTTKLPLDGYSMRPLLENPMKETWEGKDFTITAIASKEPVDLNKSAPNQEQHYSVRTKRHRYIYCRNGEEELYDHKTDPNEWTNIAKNIEQQKILISMRLRLSTIGIPLKKEIPSEL
jgi:arylsulfatase A-like enzyme